MLNISHVTHRSRHNRVFPGVILKPKFVWNLCAWQQMQEKRAADLTWQYMQNKIGNHVRIIKANPTHCWVHITQCYGQHLVREWDQNFHQWKLTWIEILDILGKNHLKNFTPEKTKFFFCYPCQKLNHILNANKRHGVDCYPKFIKSLRPLE